MIHQLLSGSKDAGNEGGGVCRGSGSAEDKAERGCYSASGSVY